MREREREKSSKRASARERARDSERVREERVRENCMFVSCFVDNIDFIFRGLKVYTSTFKGFKVHTYTVVPHFISSVVLSFAIHSY